MFQTAQLHIGWWTGYDEGDDEEEGEEPIWMCGADLVCRLQILTLLSCFLYYCLAFFADGSSWLAFSVCCICDIKHMTVCYILSVFSWRWKHARNFVVCKLSKHECYCADENSYKTGKNALGILSHTKCSSNWVSNRHKSALFKCHMKICMVYIVFSYTAILLTCPHNHWTTHAALAVALADSIHRPHRLHSITQGCQISLIFGLIRSPISSFSFWTFCLFLCSFSVRRHT